MELELAGKTEKVQQNLSWLKALRCSCHAFPAVMYGLKVPIGRLASHTSSSGQGVHRRCCSQWDCCRRQLLSCLWPTHATCLLACCDLHQHAAVEAAAERLGVQGGGVAGDAGPPIQVAPPTP